ncbi:FHA domain-containing protein [Agromyces larvae]|uniref:FHA domain-containing protein n=1 Tax=Agromyces larvae TaxID=2929802 RepID=A0ABY4BXK0_9MICO|nr:FHA domain-containing protein [Agromyces larvae]UOE43956.1 FHA domain-containing protein [Agromyces larvae]
MFEYAPAPDGSAPGFAIVTERFVTLLGHDSGAEFAGELYSLLEGEDAELADVLDLLALDGGPPDCGIVEVADQAARRVHVAVRGTVDVSMDGVASTRFSGPEGGAWVLGEASGIDALRLAIGAPTRSGARLPMHRGVVRTSEIAMAQVRRPAPTRRDPATMPIELPPVTAAIDVIEAVEATIVPDASGPASADWIVHLPDGGEVRPPVVFGRRPTPVQGESGVHVVTPSPQREISGRHLQVLVVDGVPVAIDLASTNGTLVRAPGRAPHLLIHNAQVALSPGDILDLGESYLVTVGEAGAARTEAEFGSVSPG